MSKVSQGCSVEEAEKAFGELTRNGSVASDASLRELLRHVKATNQELRDVDSLKNLQNEQFSRIGSAIQRLNKRLLVK